MKLTIVLLACALPSSTVSSRLKDKPVFRGRNTSADVALHSGRHSGHSKFVDWYASYTIGRGVWKWHQALEAYQNHLGRFAGKPVSILEVGVQSGGSINMYHDVLGGECHYYGMDINFKTTQFNNSMTTISINDQGDANQWIHFFANVIHKVDVVIDDGGHQPQQMLTTLQQALPHINPGGVHIIEDIHGQNVDYMVGLFNPAAEFLASWAPSLAGVSIYPFVVAIQLGGGPGALPVPAKAAAEFSTVVDLMAAVPKYRGYILNLKNSAWPTMFTTDGFRTLFGTFYELHTGAVTSEPEGCFSADANLIGCTMKVAKTSELQSLIARADIYPGLVQVHVAAEPPEIYATRKGNVWIPYG